MFILFSKYFNLKMPDISEMFEKNCEYSFEMYKKVLTVKIKTSFRQK